MVSDSTEMRSWPLRDEERQRFEEDLETTIRSRSSIFRLPEFVRRVNPRAFIPCQIGFGPNNWMKKMQVYKFHVAMKAQEELHLPEFNILHGQLRPLEAKIKACYEPYWEIEGDKLTQQILIDALFLLQLLVNVSVHMENSRSLRLPLQNFEDRNLFNNLDERLVVHFLIMSDVLKLENQIPLLIFKDILSNTPNVELPVCLYYFCNSVSPFSVGFLSPREIVNKNRPSRRDKPLLPISLAIMDQSHHLLHFIYFSILIFPIYFTILSPKCADSWDSLPLTFLQKLLSILGSALNIDFIQQLNEAIALIQELIDLTGIVREQTSAHKTTSSPVIPSASQLQKLHVKFSSTRYGILYTKFKEPIVTTRRVRRFPAALILPVITVNAFTETLFENLLAFETMANINPPVFARYLELMKALIRTPKDLNILKNAGIIKSHLDNDEEVLKLFNRVGSSISTLKKPTINNLNHLHHSYNQASTSESKSELAMNEYFEEINKKYEQGLKGMVEKINQLYESFWIVKAKRFVKIYASCVVKIVVILVMVYQIYLVAAPLINSTIGNDQPNYQITPT